MAHELVGGRSNHTPLSPHGEAQAKAFGIYLRKNVPSYDYFFSSPAVRTRQTLAIALDEAVINASITIDETIQELSQGHSEGGRRSEVWTEKVLAELQHDPMNFRLPGGESVVDVGERMLGWVLQTAETHPDSRILVAGHGLAIRSLAGIIGHWDHRTIIHTATPNVSLSKFGVDSGRAFVEFVGQPTVDDAL